MQQRWSRSKTNAQRSVRRAAAAVVFLVVGLPSLGTAAPVLEYVGVLLGDPPLKRPTSATLDRASGEICTTDEATRMLGVFDRDGLDRFRTDAKARLSAPRDASFDTNGDFVVLDSAPAGGRTIRRINFLGEPVAWAPEAPVQRWSPQHLRVLRDDGYLTIDREGLLAKHDRASGSLVWTRQLVDPSWERADLIGRPAEGEDGKIYVPNAGAGGILVVSPKGEMLRSFGRPGAKRGELTFPVGIALAPEGRILVLDRMRHTVLLYDSDHKFLDEFLHVGYDPGDLYHPVAIEASPAGIVWVTQGLEGRIQIFRLFDTSIEATAESSGSPDLAFPNPVD